MRLLVTGGAGFIGSNFVRYMLQSSDAEIINLDLLTYAGNLENLADVAEDSRYHFVQGDITDPAQIQELAETGVDAIVNFAAESHVDRSILDAASFVRTNVVGTQVLLEAARQFRLGRFLQISTDEVYGSLGEKGRFLENHPLEPNSPYSASKAAADLLTRSYHQTYGLDAIVTRCSNNYGPYQFPEKFIPLMILNALENRSLPIYGDGLYVRDWIHVLDHCRALKKVLHGGKSGAIYNIGGNSERKNLDVVSLILNTLGRSADLIEYVKDRPAHDRRYAIDSSLLSTELDWQPEIPFERGLKETIDWYRQNDSWVRRVRSGAYRNYYEKMYERREQTLSDL